MFTDFLTLQPEAIGLDISDLSVKIVKLKKKRGNFNLVAANTFQLRPGIIDAGEIKDENALVDALRNISSEINKIGTKYVYRVLSGFLNL